MPEDSDNEVEHRLSPTRREELKADAQFLSHRIFHFPKNPYCPVCANAKMNKAVVRTKTPQQRQERELTEPAPTMFGDSITADHMDFEAVKSRGAHGEEDAITIVDLCTKFMDVHPTGSQSADDARIALMHFVGPCVQPAQF